SAFASGPSLLILLALVLRRFTKFDPGKEPIQKLATIVVYAMTINVFFVGVELFTSLYSDMPHHLHHFEYLFAGLHGYNALTPWMWTGEALTVLALVFLYIPKIRKQEKYLAALCVAVVTAIWIEKGLAMVVTGFIPSPLGRITEYSPTVPEISITVGIYALGFFVLTLLYRIVVSVRERAQVV
ncbi:MAG: polysulfide reductase NrfD, partial [Gemmatimonadota bacterium]